MSNETREQSKSRTLARKAQRRIKTATLDLDTDALRRELERASR